MNGPPVHLITFIDRSSTATDTTLEGPYLKALDREVAEHYATGGSRLSLFLIHNMTTGKADQESAALNGIEMPTDDNDLELKRQCTAAQNEFMVAKTTGRVRALQFARDASVPESSTGGSDLWGILQVVSEAAATDADSVQLRVLVLSDMMQCMPGRCLESRAPRNAAEAATWGSADAARVQQEYNLNLDVLKRATFTAVSGHFALAPHYQYVPAYWRALLGAMGVPESNIVFNP